MCVIWGLPYLLIRVAVRHLEPATLVFLRTGIGALLLVPIAAARRELQPLIARWGWVLVYTVVELAIPWVLLSTAEERLSSSLSGLLVAAVPLVGAALSWSVGGRDRLGPRGLLGLCVGLAGVAALVGFDVRGGDVGSVALVAVVVVGYATGPLVLDRQLGDLPVLGVVAASLVLCAVAYAPYGLTHLPARVPSGRVIAAVCVLGVVCTALAFVLFFHLIAEVGPVRATVITYVNPAVAVVLGVVFLHEHFGAGTAVGFVLILLGSALATGARPRERALVGEP
jgi:drug/metabolite transporter (DMT)-like permease